MVLTTQSKSSTVDKVQLVPIPLYLSILLITNMHDQKKRYHGT